MKPTPLRACLTGLALVPILLWTLFPLYWIATASLKTERSLYAKPPEWQHDTGITDGAFMAVLGENENLTEGTQLITSVTGLSDAAAGSTAPPGFPGGGRGFPGGGGFGGGGGNFRGGGGRGF